MIGYVPHSNNLNAPGDRRRFGFYAKSKNMQFETASTKNNYNVVYITSSANISAWITYKQKNKNTKLIFEIIDAYMLNKNLSWNFFRGFYRFLQGRESKLYFNYNNIYKKIFSIADAVVCSTQAQKDFILQYNNNVHISLDYFEEDITYKKTDYTTNKPFVLAWEGLSYTVKNILVLKTVLEKFNNVHLKIITNEEIPIVWNFKKKTKKLFKDCKFSYQIIPWEINTFSKEIAEADIAIIPINTSDELHYNKPENKLILFWKIGIPVITSETPAYKKVFNAINYDLTCKGDKDWIDKLNLFIESKIDIKEHMNAVNTYIDTFHSKEKFITDWDDIFESVKDSFVK